MSNFDALADVVSFTFADGVQTYTEADVFEFTEFLVSTNASGAITSWAVEFSKVAGGQPSGTGIATCKTSPDILPAGVCAGDPLGSGGGVSDVGGGESLTSGAWSAVVGPDVNIYNYTGNNFTIVNDLFTTADFLSISLILSSPLSRNISNFDASGIINTFSFSNGVNVVNDFNATAETFLFTTDGMGGITEWAVSANSGTGDGSVSCQLGTSIVTTNGCEPGGPFSGTDHLDLGISQDPVLSTGAVVDSPGIWTFGIVPLPFEQTFEIIGTSTGIGWSWRIDIAGGTVASAINVGPVTSGGAASLFKNEFVDSINASAGTSGCVATSQTLNIFKVECSNPFAFFVANAAGTGSICLVTDSLGEAGCSFNPTMVQVLPPLPVPTLVPLALLVLSGLLFATVLRFSRERGSTTWNL